MRCSSPTSATPRPAAKVEGVEFVEVERALIRGIAAQRRRAASGSSAALDVRGLGGCCAAPASTLVPRRGAGRAPARGQGPRTSSTLDPPRAATITERGVRARSRRSRFVGRTERELAWRFESSSTSTAPTAPRSRRSSPPGRTARRRTRATSDRVDRAGRDGRRRRRRGRRRLRVRLHAHVRDGPLPDELREAYDVVLEAQLAGLDAVRAGRHRQATPTPPRARSIDGAGLGERFGHGLGHGVGLMVHEAPTLRPESRTRSSRATSSRSSRDLPRGTSAGSGSRTSSSSGGRAGGADVLPEGARHRRLDLSATMAEVVSTNQFKNGMHIELEGGAWRIVEFQHVKPGKGGAFVRTKLKSTRQRRGRRQDVPRRREVRARPHRAEERAVPLRRG